MGEFVKLVITQALQAYKWAISPLFPPACRYIPTCSEYALEAVERYGALRGTLIAAWRVCRCHPFARGGYDPVVHRSPLSAGQSHRTDGHGKLHANWRLSRERS